MNGSVLANRNTTRYGGCVMVSVERGSGMDAATLPDLLSYGDLDRYGVTRHRFDRLIDAGEYERIAAGLFLRSGVTDDTTAAWMAIATKKPEATICLLSALAVHNLTDEIPTRSDIAIPRGTQSLKIRYAPIGWHRFDAATFEVGRTEHALSGGLSIGLYSPERTIIDIFRLRHEWGSDLAVGALKRWLRERGNSPAMLLTLAERFPKARPGLQSTLEVLL